MHALMWGGVASRLVKGAQEALELPSDETPLLFTRLSCDVIHQLISVSTQTSVLLGWLAMWHDVVFVGRHALASAVLYQELLARPQWNASRWLCLQWRLGRPHSPA